MVFGLLVYRTCRTVVAAPVFIKATRAANTLLIIDLHARRRSWVAATPTVAHATVSGPTATGLCSGQVLSAMSS